MKQQQRHNFLAQRLVIGFLCSMIFCSCKKFVEVKPAPDLIETAAIFTDARTAQSAVAGVYSQLRFYNGHLTNAGTSVFTSLYTDELTTSAASPTYDPFLTNSLQPSTASINANFWNPAYKNIYRTNAIIQGLEKSVSIADDIKNQLKAEMIFVRSFPVLDRKSVV